VIPRAAIAITASWLYGENYVALPMTPMSSWRSPTFAFLADRSDVTVYRGTRVNS
jgi:hypothetical protein